MAKKPAKKPAKPASQASSETTVTRIVASDEKPKKKTTAKKDSKPTTTKKEKVEKIPKKERTNPARGFGGYFTGAWYELRQVRWPDRRATWGMTGALIAFTLFFVLVILLLDALFQYLFTLVIK